MVSFATMVITLAPCRHTTHADSAAKFTAAYACALGAALMAAPTPVFSLLFDASAVPRGYVRLGGSLLALFGVYYAAAAAAVRDQVSAFYRATVWGRLALAGWCVALWASGEISGGVLFFAAMNAVGALSMWRALRRDAASAS